MAEDKPRYRLTADTSAFTAAMRKVGQASNNTKAPIQRRVDMLTWTVLLLGLAQIVLAAAVIRLAVGS